MKEDRRWFEDVCDPETSNGPLKIYNYKEVPEFIVNWVIMAAFPEQRTVGTSSTA